MERFYKLIQDRELARYREFGNRRGLAGMPSVLDGGLNYRELRPVSSGIPDLAPVNRSTLPSVLAGGSEGGLVMQRGNIQAIKHLFNVHAKGEVVIKGKWYKCFPHPAPEGGVSHDGKKYLTFESTWTFKAMPPRKSGVDFWVKQKLFRVVILYCPKDKERYRVETVINEVFRLKGNETDSEKPDVHRDPRDFDSLCDGENTWCQMSCYELGILSLQETGDTAYRDDYSRTEETESYTSEDRGETWGPRAGHDDGPGQPGQHPPPDNLKDVPDHAGFYIADYFIEHCPTATPGDTISPVNPDPKAPDTGGGTPTSPETGGDSPTHTDSGGGATVPQGVVAAAVRVLRSVVAAESGDRLSVAHGEAAAGLGGDVE